MSGLKPVEYRYLSTSTSTSSSATNEFNPLIDQFLPQPIPLLFGLDDVLR
jgi:hypothetical protein